MWMITGGSHGASSSPCLNYEPASLCLAQESTEAGDGALCTAVWCDWCRHHASNILMVWVAGAPLSLLPDLGFSHGLLVAWDRAAPPRTQAGSGEQGRLPSEMISIHPRVSSLSTLMDELMKQREGGGGLVLDINSWRSAERYSVFLQGGHFTPGVCGCAASKWFVCTEHLVEFPEAGAVLLRNKCSLMLHNDVTDFTGSVFLYMIKNISAIKNCFKSNPRFPWRTDDRQKERQTELTKKADQFSSCLL